MKENDGAKLVENFRQWIDENKSVVNCPTSDEFLLRFLRVTDFDLAEAKERLINFWKYRSENSKWFTNRDLVENPSMREISESGYCFQLPKPTEDGCLIFVMRIGHYNSNIYKFDDVTKYAFAVSDIVNSQESVQTKGLIIILDMSEVSFQHVPQFTADFSRRYVDCWEKMYPTTISRIHFYNYPSLFDPVYGLFRTLYFRGFDERILIHAKDESKATKNPLHEFIDPALLPKEYDGQLGSMDGEINQNFVQWTRERNHVLKQMENFSIDPNQIQTLIEKIRQI